jgi:hypothetical protein
MNQNSRPSEDKKTGLELLRVPFPEGQISKLPKFRKDSTARKIRCQICGGYHPEDAVHLDYVGHAALTNRLLDADPEWNWEPLAVDESGLPRMDRCGGMWIKLTVCGVTRLGYGHAEGKQGGDAIKEVIGDALRNAAMRFGAALDLWCKGDLHADDDSGEHHAPPQEASKHEPSFAPLSEQQVVEIAALADEVGVSLDKILAFCKARTFGEVPATAYQRIINKLEQSRKAAA